MKQTRLSMILVLAMIAALVPLTAAPAAGGVGSIQINEIRIDQSGSDNDEYFELTGPSGMTLDGYTYLVIGDGTGGSGVIENVTDLTGSSMAGSGFFVAAEVSFSLATADLTTSLNFENSDNVTHMLVTGFSGSNGDDLDTDDDGTFDTMPWTSVADSVALLENTSGEKVYGTTSIGPDGSFVPAHVSRCTGTWEIGGFSLGANDTPGAANDCQIGTCGESATLISTIQGDGASSPEDGNTHVVEAVVVADHEGDDGLSGFYLQEEDEDNDGDADTSDGLFVYNRFRDDVAEGDVVRVRGTVDEFFGFTEITDVTSLIVCSSGASVTPAEAAIGMDFETVEGMKVEFTHDLYISEFFNFDRYGEVVLTTARQYQPSQLEDPGSAAAYAIEDANEANRITLDDGRSVQNPDPALHPAGGEFTLVNRFRGGDILRDLNGVIEYSFGEFRIQPAGGATHIVDNPRPTAPDPIRGDVRVASFNVLNFFTSLDDGSDDCGPTGDLECRGADNATEFQRQLDKLVAGIIGMDADIVGIQEIENDLADVPVMTLVAALNAVEGPGTWEWVGEVDHYNDYPVRNEIIYKPGSVVAVGDPQTIADTAFDQTRPGDTEPVGRPPVAQTFAPVDHPDRLFTVVVNHFKSKGSSCSSIGDPFVDHAGNCNGTRVAQAEALMSFVASLQEATGDDDVLVIGDLNSYAKEDPIDRIKLGPDGTHGGGDNFFDLVNKSGKNTAYGYVFDGQLGTLDHALASISLLPQVKGVTEWHINADEPDIFDYDTSFKKDAQDALYEPLPYRVSDHDPVIVGLTLTD